MRKIHKSGNHPQDESAKICLQFREDTLQKFRIRAMFWQPAQTYLSKYGYFLIFFPPSNYGLLSGLATFMVA
jgi:hypothetical protein